MRTLFVTLEGAVLLVAMAVMPKADASTGPIPLNCNRACLEGLVNQYLTAVVAHNPTGLPVSKDVVYTENNQVLALGDGYWKTAEEQQKSARGDGWQLDAISHELAVAGQFERELERRTNENGRDDGTCGSSDVRAESASGHR